MCLVWWYVYVYLFQINKLVSVTYLAAEKRNLKLLCKQDTMHYVNLRVCQMIFLIKQQEIVPFLYLTVGCLVFNGISTHSYMLYCVYRVKITSTTKNSIN